MRETFIRSDHISKNLNKDGYRSSNEYAVDTTTETGREIAHGAVRVASSNLKSVQKDKNHPEGLKQSRHRTPAAGMGVGEKITESPNQTTRRGSKSFRIKDLQNRTRTTERPSEKESVETKSSKGGTPLDEKATVQKTANAKRVNASKRFGLEEKGEVRQEYQIHHTQPTSKQTQLSKSSAKRDYVSGRTRGSKNTEQVGPTNRTIVGRNSRFPSGVANNPAARAIKSSRKEQTRQAFLMARRRAIMSARSQLSVGRRLAASIEKMRRAVASLGMIAGGAGSAVLVFMVVILLVASILISGFGIFFSPDANKRNELKFPTVVRDLNTEFQNEINSIKASVPHDAVELYGARATWKEVLAVYAVKTTTDPENGIEVATMDVQKKRILTNIFWDMNTISYETHTESYSAPVETKDAEGNTVVTQGVEYFTTLIITVSHMTPDEAADTYGFNKSQKDELHELLEMGNSLWMAVLYGLTDGAYGEYGEIVQVALSQVGNIGGEPYWSWFGYASRVEWCACFVSWCAEQSGYIADGLVPKYSWCPFGVQWFQNQNRWIDGSMEPEPGMIIFYDWNKDGGQDGISDHTGIVEYVENGIVHTIEGNCNDGVAQREVPVGNFQILGYGFMAEEVDSD